MAGLWERIRPDGTDRIPVHLVVAGLRAVFVNGVDGTKGATRVQVRNALNNHVELALTAAEEADLNGIADTIDAQANNTSKIIFLQNIEYVMIAAEFGAIDETKWRNDLGI